MQKRDDNGDALIGFAILMAIVGVACAAYVYVPFYGATPLAIGGSILFVHGIDEVRARRRRR